jgi:pimeloyl-ACP methyl ester carboxylesterase
VPTLMIQGGADWCDEPASSEGLDAYFSAGYRRLMVDGVGHFPLRESPTIVAQAIIEHLG